MISRFLFIIVLFAGMTGCRTTYSACYLKSEEEAILEEAMFKQSLAGHLESARFSVSLLDGSWQRSHGFKNSMEMAQAGLISQEEAVSQTEYNKARLPSATREVERLETAWNNWEEWPFRPLKDKSNNWHAARCRCDYCFDKYPERRDEHLSLWATLGQGLGSDDPVYVKGHLRNGFWVRPYFRSNPRH